MLADGVAAFGQELRLSRRAPGTAPISTGAGVHQAFKLRLRSPYSGFSSWNSGNAPGVNKTNNRDTRPEHEHLPPPCCLRACVTVPARQPRTRASRHRAVSYTHLT